MTVRSNIGPPPRREGGKGRREKGGGGTYPRPLGLRSPPVESRPAIVHALNSRPPLHRSLNSGKLAEKGKEEREEEGQSTQASVGDIHLSAKRVSRVLLQAEGRRETGKGRESFPYQLHSPEARISKVPWLISRGGKEKERGRRYDEFRFLPWCYT